MFLRNLSQKKKSRTFKKFFSGRTTKVYLVAIGEHIKPDTPKKTNKEN